MATSLRHKEMHFSILAQITQKFSSYPPCTKTTKHKQLKMFSKFQMNATIS